MSRKEYRAAYRAANKDKIAEKAAAYRVANKDKIAEREAAYYQANKDKAAAYRVANKDKIAEREAAYYQANKDKAAAYRVANKDKIAEKKAACYKSRYNSDPLFALSSRTRSLIRNSLRNKGYTKRSRTHDILGCSFDQFKTHLESQFKQGMSWENRHLWHIDHRKPLATAKTEQEVLKLSYYTNLQPLWAADNLKKGARYG